MEASMTAEALFQEYIEHIQAWASWSKMPDGSDPDESLMRWYEERMYISENGKKAFREELLIRMASRLRKGLPFTLEDNGGSTTQSILIFQDRAAMAQTKYWQEAFHELRKRTVSDICKLESYETALKTIVNIGKDNADAQTLLACAEFALSLMNKKDV